jgi:hypothetical protein
MLATRVVGAAANRCIIVMISSAACIELEWSNAGKTEGAEIHASVYYVEDGGGGRRKEENRAVDPAKNNARR